MSINVKRESILSYGGLALATAIIAAVSVWAQNHAVKELEGIMNGLNQRAKVAASLDNAMKDRAISARNQLLASEAQGREKAAKDARASHAQVGKLLAEYNELIGRATDMTSEARALAKEMNAVEAAYAPVALAIVSMAEKGQTEEAIAKLNRECVPLLARLDSVMDSYTKLSREREQELVTNIEESLAQQQMLIAALAAIVVVGAILAAVLITRRLLAALGAEPSELSAAANRVADGDLKPLAGADQAPEGSVLAAMARMQTGLVTLVRGVHSSADNIATASGQIAAGNQDLSGRTEQQASALQQTASQMHTMTEAVMASAQGARQANELAVEAASVAERGGEVVGRVVTTMTEISESSRRIADIIGVIDGIAFQTNILALNAAVEAARAGDQGRGFAVVASEVRSLAGRSAEAAREIKSLIQASVERVEHGSALVSEAGETMTHIVERVRKVNSLIGEINAASDEQTKGINQVNQAVASLDQSTQQNAALVEESAAAAEGLRQQSADLLNRVGMFQLAH